MRMTTHIHSVHDLKYSNDGQQFLVISGTTQAKLYDRDGEELCVHPYPYMNGQSDLTRRATFIKGDQYIRDMKNTSCVLACFDTLSLSLLN